MTRTLAPLSFHVALAALAACAGPTAPEPQAPAPTATEPAPPKPSPAAALMGDWHSSACGDRAYERRLHLSENGTFKAEDLVSPCPPKVMCVWSGIVETQGTWALEGATLQLTITPGATPRPGVAPFPASLTLDGAGAPAEGAAGASLCPYVR